MIEEKIINVFGIDYIVSSDGKVYSTHNVGRGKYHKEISQRENEDGYMVITAGKTHHRRSMRVHRMVALAFVPNPNNLPEVDHIDNNRKNNSASNLQWISGTDNKKKTPFKRRSSTHKGILNGRARLTETDIVSIRDLYMNGTKQSEIAKLFNVGWSTVHNIIIHNTWKGI